MIGPEYYILGLFLFLVFCAGVYVVVVIWWLRGK